MRKKTSIIVAVLGSFLLFSMGCQKVANNQTGRIVVKITDDPFPIEFIEEASVTITKVEIRNEQESEENHFTTLFEGSETFNLIELRNGLMEEFLDLEIPVGNYNLIRIYVENASIAIKDSETYSVKVPSGSQTGVKMFIKPSLKVAGGLTAEVLLDFNLDRSFVLKGNMDTPAGIKGFNFKPVIRAVNNTTAGVIQGIITDINEVPLSEVAVTIELEDFFATAYTDEQGFYAIPGIPVGVYTMTAVKEGYVTSTIDAVQIIEGNVNIQDFVLEIMEETAK